MHIRRWVLTPLTVALFAASAASVSPVLAQEQKKDKKLEKAQQEEIKVALKIADDAQAGLPAPTDVTMTMHPDFLKAQEGRTYVPFTVTMPADQLPSPSATVYLRVVAKGAAAVAAAPAAGDKKDKDKSKNQRPEFAFEDVYFVDLKAPAAGKPYQLSRAFSVPAGDYDVIMVTKERPPVGKDKKDKNATFKAGVLKHALTVPDFWNGELATSSVILAANVEPLAAPPTRQEMIEQPYTLGMTKITPALSSDFKKADELSIVFIVYNTQQDANKKPDVSVEYGFYQKDEKAEKGEKFFNKTNPQNFNATTLPPQFDPAAGHQLVAGQSVPLGSFPEGQYRLEVKITDKLSGKTMTRNIAFSVAS
jgi:hypothetical protein